MLIEIVSDGAFEFACGAETPSANLLFREGGEEAFYLVKPACRSGREVDMEAWILHEPTLDGLSGVNS